MGLIRPIKVLSSVTELEPAIIMHKIYDNIRIFKVFLKLLK